MTQNTKTLPFGAVPDRLTGWAGFVWLIKQLWKPHRTQRTNVWYMRLMIFGSSVMMLSGLAGVLNGFTQVGLGIWLGMFCATPGLFSFVIINRRICLTFKLENREHRLATRQARKDCDKLAAALVKLRAQVQGES